MSFLAEIKDLYKDLEGNTVVALSTKESPAEVEKLKGKPLKVAEQRKHRSLDANAMLWACLGEIAAALNTDKWTVYLMMLRRYGRYTYICVRKDAVDMIRKQWRETEIVGDIDINGQSAVQMLCYYGSSTYDTKQFSVLLDGVVSEMEEMGLPTPDRGDMRRTLEQWEKRNEKKESAES